MDEALAQLYFKRAITAEAAFEYCEKPRRTLKNHRTGTDQNQKPMIERQFCHLNPYSKALLSHRRNKPDLLLQVGSLGTSVCHAGSRDWCRSICVSGLFLRKRPVLSIFGALSVNSAEWSDERGIFPCVMLEARVAGRSIWRAQDSSTFSKRETAVSEFRFHRSHG